MLAVHVAQHGACCSYANRQVIGFLCTSQRSCTQDALDDAAERRTFSGVVVGAALCCLPGATLGAMYDSHRASREAEQLREEGYRREAEAQARRRCGTWARVVQGLMRGPVWRSTVRALKTTCMLVQQATAA